jgi:uncharacterized spore protein YtfJ
VYGEPVQVDGKTIIPVARVAFGFKKKAETDGKPESGPSAGGVSAKPVGVVEVSGEETRFVPVAQTKKFAIIAAIGSGVGLVLGWVLGRRGKHNQA